MCLSRFSQISPQCRRISRQESACFKIICSEFRRNSGISMTVGGMQTIKYFEQLCLNFVEFFCKFTKKSAKKRSPVFLSIGNTDLSSSSASVLAENSLQELKQALALKADRTAERLA